MHPLVRDLYKRFMFVGRDYPRGIDYVRAEVKKAFRSNAHLTKEIDILRAVNKGRYMVREMIAVIQIKKYRAMKHRYGQKQE